MIRKKTLLDQFNNKVYPNTLVDCIYTNETTTLSNLLGNTDISTVGDGTVTGAIKKVDDIKLEDICK